MMKITHCIAAVTLSVAAASAEFFGNDATTLGEITMTSANWSTPEGTTTATCVVEAEEYPGSDIVECTKAFYMVTNATKDPATNITTYGSVRITSKNDAYSVNGRYVCLDDFSTNNDATFTDPDTGSEITGQFQMDPTSNESSVVPITLKIDDDGKVTFTAVIEGTNCEATFETACGEVMNYRPDEANAVTCEAPSGGSSKSGLSSGATVGIAFVGVIVVLLLGFVISKSRVGYDRIA